jgi:hypothetical protein
MGMRCSAGASLSAKAIKGIPSSSRRTIPFTCRGGW